MSCEKSATVQTELPPKSDTLYGTVNLTLTPDCSARTLFAGPIAPYPRGRGQWKSRGVRGSFTSANGSGSHRISMTDALVPPILIDIR
jgi:hypothetical protein